MALTAQRAPVDPRKAAQQLQDEVKRVVRLLRSVRRPDAPAVGEWSVAEVAMHLSQAWLAVPGLARQDLGDIRAVLPSIGDSRSLIRDIWDLGGLTTDGVRADPERDPAVLASRIEARSAEFLSARLGVGTERRPWMVDGTDVALVTLTCHLLNETLVHGWDIATGDGRDWEIPRDHANTVFDGFLVPVLQALGPRDMVDQVVAAGLYATYELRLKRGSRHVFVFEDGALTVDPPPGRPIDCIIDADPAAFLMVVWNRLPLSKAVASRQLVPSGPKAWLGPRLRALMRNP